VANLLQIDRPDVQPFLRSSERLARLEDSWLVALVAIGIESDAPKLAAAEVPQSTEVDWNLSPQFIKVCVDIAERASKPNIDPAVAARVMRLGMSEDSTARLFL
jgi:hypothetical protein